MILFSLTHWMETVLIRKCFMRYSNFAHKLNSQLWMETRLLCTKVSYLKVWAKVIFALARTAKYERILNVLALVAQNKQPCRSERLALTHRYTNKQTHTHKQTHTAEGGRADQRGVQMDGESLSVPTPSRVICCPICTITARPPNPRDAHTHTLWYTRTCIPYLSPYVSWVWHKQTSHTHCVHMWRSGPRMQDVCTSL